ncbi:MAG: hypothetical protein GY820_00255 [Gammaproteobacteria bacterium]|nr:hypothetical protein [Gammaproteobacteria bacterium]
MLHKVPRTCTFNADEFSSKSHGIDFFRDADAYVLLGDPGAGKTTLFEQEAADSDGLYLSARDFLTFNRVDEWQGKTLFIDGLDETRAGKDDARTPLDAIRRKLDQLGRPHFRLSCREADWLGGNDQTALNTCAPNGMVTVLHLNALTDEDIKVILENDVRVNDNVTFMQKTQQFSLTGLRYNPQTLDMLIEAVQGNKWPNTKLETYELACQKMAVEHNSEHKASRNKNLNSIKQLLDAAGFLYATLLLANGSAFNKNNDFGEGQIYLGAIKIPDDLPSIHALKTRLFKCTHGEKYTPIHRSVAEFLGARYLAKKIYTGLPLNRVLALMTGFDGGVVAALRGLMSWLSAHSIEARDHLIEIDPLGVVLYGDVQPFSKQTKQQLLSALSHVARNNGQLRYDYLTSHPFAGLTTKDMADTLLALLISPSREQHDQQILHCILDGLYSSCEPIPELKDTLVSIVRDNTYWEGIRVGALRAFIHQYPEDIASLLALADDFRSNKIEDIDDRFLSLLLEELFPDVISASEILNYLKPSREDHHRPISFNDFWYYFLVKRIQDKDLPILLDDITRRDINDLRQSQVHDWFRLTGKLLVRGVETFAESISDDRLYDWLSLGLDEYQHSRLENEHSEKIRLWLKNHPERHLALISEGMNRITTPKNMNFEIHMVFARLYNATSPDDLGLWWLDRALNDDNQHKKESFSQSWWLLIKGNGHKGLSLEFFEDWVKKHPEFKDEYKKLVVCDIEDWRKEHAQSAKKRALKHKEEKVARLALIRRNLTAMQNGSVHPQVLHSLAAAYFNPYSNINGETGPERLADYVDHDENLIVAVTKGLRKVFDRSDLPKTSEIFSLATEQREHYIRLPFLTCMDELYQENTAMLDTLSDDLSTKALAFWYTYDAGTEPAWVKPLSFSRPELTANIFIEYVNAMLKAKVQHIHGVYQLVHDPDYHEIAKLSAVRMLKIYPVRAKKQQASALEYLLKAAIVHGNRTSLLELITERLALKSLDIAQHVYWLATGLVVAPAQYESIMRKYVSDNVTRINYLSAFLYEDFGSQQLGLPLPPNTIGLIIELLAPRCTPYWPERGDTRVTRAMNDGDYVRSLINRLSENSNLENAQVISHLLSLPQLSVWHETLRSARQTQQISRREALFRHPGADAVAFTLNNLKPANVADLAALVIDHLEKLSVEMHTSNTDNFKRFWNEDGYARPGLPKPENSCRDYLAEKFRTLFSTIDVDVQPETHEAGDKRADMRLSFGSNGHAYHLPIEIKLDHSADLWRAIHEQLIPLYTLDPETQGRGIFLVIWFGEKNMPAPPSGKKPKTATELGARLIETLTTEEKKLINVFVLDVSKPDNSIDTGTVT